MEYSPINVLSPDEFTEDRHSLDNSCLTYSQPYLMPKILGVVNANSIPCLQSFNELAIMFEDEEGNIFWCHSGMPANYIYLLELLKYPKEVIEDLMFNKLHFKKEEQE